LITSHLSQNLFYHDIASKRGSEQPPRLCLIWMLVTLLRGKASLLDE